MPNLIAAAYLRRSYASEARPGDASEDMQLEAVKRLCGPDVAVYKDWNMSGRRTDRPDYLRLQADIKAGLIGSVCAYSLSRLGRSTRDLLDFVALCKEHGVTLQTSVDGINTAGAMGTLIFTIMAAVGQFEAEIAAERSRSADAARRARHEAADSLLPDGKLPNSVPMYGFRHVPALDANGSKLVVREPDPERPISVVLDAYGAAGSLRGAAIALNAAGVPSPKGAAWGASTLARILRAHDPDLLPELNATGRRRPAGKPARLRGLVVCHCGSLMTPNLARGQYRCPRGRDKLGPALHGPTTIAERRLLGALQPEAARIPQHVTFEFADIVTGERERIAEAKRRAGVRYGAGEMADAEYLAEVKRLDNRAAELGRQSGEWTGVRMERPIDLVGDPAEVNGVLRRWWARVRLDSGQRPHVEWFVDPDQLEAVEAVEQAERYAR